MQARHELVDSVDGDGVSAVGCGHGAKKRRVPLGGPFFQQKGGP